MIVSPSIHFGWCVEGDSYIVIAVDLFGMKSVCYTCLFAWKNVFEFIGI